MKTLENASFDIKSSILEKLNEKRKEREQLGQEITDLEKKSRYFTLWEELPVSPTEFCNSKDFLGDSRGKIWPYIREDMDIIFSGKDEFGRMDYSPACNLYLNISGIGSGKTLGVSLYMSYIIYWLHCLKNPFEYFGKFDQSSTILLMSLAPTEEKAQKLIYKKVYDTVSQIPWFRDKGYLPDPRNRNQLSFYKLGVNPETIDKQEMKYHKMKINMRYGAGKGNTVVGEDLFCGGVDEACTPGGFDLKDGRDKALDIFETMNARRISRFGDAGINMFISSAGTEGRWLEQMVQDAEVHRAQHSIPDSQKILKLSSDLNVYAVRRPAYKCNPMYFNMPTFSYRISKTTEKGITINYDLEIPEYYKRSMEIEPEKLLRDICAVPTTAYQPFFTNWPRVLSMVNVNRVDPLPDNGKDNVMPVFSQEENGIMGAWELLPEWFRGVPGEEIYAAVDLGTGGTESSGRDSTGLALAKRGEPIDRDGISFPSVVVLLSIRFKASKKKLKTKDLYLEKKNDEVLISDVRDFLIKLNKERGFQFAKISYDGFASMESLQTLNKLGYNAVKESCTKETWENCRSLWYDGRIDIFKDDWLLYEMSKLEDKGLYITHAHGFHDDEAQAMARAVELATEGFVPDRPKPRARCRLGPSMFGGGGGGGGAGVVGGMSGSRVLMPKGGGYNPGIPQFTFR